MKADVSVRKRGSLPKFNTYSQAGERRKLMATLSERELKVLRCIENGFMNKEIAYELGISVNTVKGYVSNFIAIGNFRNRVDVARWARFNPKVYEGESVEAAFHPDGCLCAHPKCVEFRAFADEKPF